MYIIVVFLIFYYLYVIILIHIKYTYLNIVIESTILRRQYKMYKFI